MKTNKIIYFCFAVMLFYITSCNSTIETPPLPIAKQVSELNIFTENFQNGLGQFTQYNDSGKQSWTLSKYQYIMMSGNVDNVANANSRWLISPSINVPEGVTSALTFEYVARGFANISNDVSIWISENYQRDSMPSKVIWTRLNLIKAIINSTSWNMTSIGDISLKAFIGKKVNIAIKYISSKNQAGVLQIRNFVVRDHVKGSESTPYTVSEATTFQGTVSWVKGYIVGYVSGISISTAVLNADNCTVQTNLLIADSKTETNVANCMAVQLPAGVLRTGLNLATNKTNIGKQVTLYGSLEAYFGKPGLKSPTYYLLEDNSSGGTKPFDTSRAIFYETFGGSLGSFTTNNALGAQVWGWTSAYGAVMAGTTIENEDWLISPSINLTGKTTARLAFDFTINLNNSSGGTVTNMQSNYTLCFSADNGITWEPIVIPTYPAGNNWTFVNSGNIVLPDKYLGISTFKFAFKYHASEPSSWEIKNVIINP